MLSSAAQSGRLRSNINILFCPIHVKVQGLTRTYVMYLLDKLKPFEQKDYFSLKEQNGLGWYLAYVCVGSVFKWGSNKW